MQQKSSCEVFNKKDSLHHQTLIYDSVLVSNVLKANKDLKNIRNIFVISLRLYLTSVKGFDRWSNAKWL